MNLYIITVWHSFAIGTMHQIEAFSKLMKHEDVPKRIDVKLVKENI